MTDVSISVLSDPESQAGGGAILRLTGVALVPPGSTFRIDPIDDDAAAKVPEGWPVGDLKPGGQRIITDGVDLVLGREVIESPALLPGTPVTISVPAVGARAELRWPSLPVARTERRPAVVVSGEKRAAELAARTAAAQAEAERVKHEAAEAARKAVEAAALSSLTITPETTQAPDAGLHAAKSASPEAEPLAKLKPVPAPRAPASLSPVVPEPPKPAPLKPILAATTGTSKTLPAAPKGAAAVATQRPGTPSDTSISGLATQPQRSFWAAAAAPFVLGCIFAGALAAIVPALNRRPAPPATVQSVDATPSAAASVAVDRTGSFAAPRLAEILAVPETSPLGERTAGVTLDEALQRADRGLSGQVGSTDRREAKFWLRKALSLGLGDERLLWAMTQLGTLYAAPDGEAPDYASARILWELAAAKGDPVALCFLASVFENGLGTTKDASRALALYEQAKARGGCRGLDDAITRLKKAAP